MYVYLLETMAEGIYYSHHNYKRCFIILYSHYDNANIRNECT